MSTLLSPEARLLLLTIGTHPDPRRIMAALRDPALDWNRLTWLADRERAIPALQRTLRALPEGTVDPARLAHLSRVCRVSEFRMLRLEQLLAGALDTLAREGIDAVLLKGAGLATTVYGSFAARPMYDVDLLVRPEQARSAWQALRSAGWAHDAEECPAGFYDSHYHLPPLDDPMRTGLALELHTAPTASAIRLTGPMICRDARRVRFQGRSTFAPSPAHQVLHLAAHFAWTHGLASAAWRTFQDLHHLIASGTIDWDVVVRDAIRIRAGTSCYWTFRLAGMLTATAIPDAVLRAVRPPRPEWLLTMLGRHYAAALFPQGPACPSMRVTQTLWSAGMAPRWSGHGAVRPWHRGEVWVAQSPGVRKRTLTARAGHHMRRLSAWRRYTAGLFVHPPNPNHWLNTFPSQRPMDVPDA